jgi:hypothetical protein
MSTGMYGVRVKVYNYTPYVVNGEVSFSCGDGGGHPIHCEAAQFDKNGAMIGDATMDSEHWDGCYHEGIHLTVYKGNIFIGGGKLVEMSYGAPLQDALAPGGISGRRDSNSWYEVKLDNSNNLILRFSRANWDDKNGAWAAGQVDIEK